MTAPGCADPSSCPVPAPDEVDLRRLTSTVWPAGLPLRRGHRREHAPTAPAPAVDALPGPTRMSRFAPLVDQPHSYVARREPAALLESVLHDVLPTAPRIRWRQLGSWSLSHVTLLQDVRLLDLRDPALDQLGIRRDQLLATEPGHYPCTRVWAEHLLHRHAGNQPTLGMVWHSRQAEVHAAQGVRPLLADVLVGEQAEVAVLWPTPDTEPLLADAGATFPLDAGRGHELVVDLANLMGAPPPLLGPGTH